MEIPKLKPTEEWFAQAQYDMDTAQIMYDSGRYIYVVFMCHLSIEKALKGLTRQKFQKEPKKSHNLEYFCEILEIELPARIRDFIDNLNDSSIPTRYPEELRLIHKDFPKENVSHILQLSRETLECLKQKLHEL